jgi:hypothetical protein
MWGLLERKTQTLIVVGLAVVLTFALQAGTELLTGNQPSPLKLISLVTFLIATVLVVVANFVWRRVWRWFPILARSIFPDLNGRWDGTLETTWKDADGNSPGPINATIWVKQTLFSIHIRQQTNESVSNSSRESLGSFPSADRYLVWYSYSNQPKNSVSFRSGPHDGVGVLEINLESDPNRLTGQYYTSRRTSGDLAFTRAT